MRRIIVHSGSSIKIEEKEQYGVDILPIQLQMMTDVPLLPAIGDRMRLDSYV